jgi:formate dehydrogenase major subunit
LERDRAVLDLTWDYPLVGETQEPDPDAVMREIGGRKVDGSFVASYEELADDGSTACGSWIHAGIYADGVNQAARKRPGGEQNWIAHEWGWAWRRTSGCSTTARPPIPRGGRGRSASATSGGTPTRASGRGWATRPTSRPTRRRTTGPPRSAKGMEAIRGDAPFVVHPDGLGWIYAPSGLVDGPLPAHYEPHESPIEDNALYSVRADPTRQRFDRDDNLYNPPGSEVFPYALTTYRVTEHHTAGGMSRTVPYLAELMPEAFVEVSPALAAERGLEHATGRPW